MLEKNDKIIISLCLVVILSAAAFIFLNYGKNSNSSVEEVSTEVIGEKVTNFINDIFFSGEEKVSLVGVFDEKGMYRIRMNIETTEFDSYTSKDGAFLFMEWYDLEEDLALEEPDYESSEAQEFIEGDLVDFIGCLEQANFVIYGANWCGWTSQLVEMLGGWEMVNPIYVECTQEGELCSEKEITSYPTVLINDEQFKGSRTFEAFSEATGCSLPESQSLNQENNPAGGC